MRQRNILGAIVVAILVAFARFRSSVGDAPSVDASPSEAVRGEGPVDVVLADHDAHEPRRSVEVSEEGETVPLRVHEGERPSRAVVVDRSFAATDRSDRVRIDVRADSVDVDGATWKRLEIRVGGAIADAFGTGFARPTVDAREVRRSAEGGVLRATFEAERSLLGSELEVLVREIEFDEIFGPCSTLELGERETVYVRRIAPARPVDVDRYEFDLGSIERAPAPVVAHLVVRCEDAATCRIRFGRLDRGGGSLQLSGEHRTFEVETDRRVEVRGRPDDPDPIWSVWGEALEPTFGPDGALRPREVVAPSFGLGDDVVAELVHVGRLEVVFGEVLAVELAGESVAAVLTPAEEYLPLVFEDGSLDAMLAPMRLYQPELVRGRRGSSLAFGEPFAFEWVPPGAYVLELRDRRGRRGAPFIVRELSLPLAGGGEVLEL
ncbi:MAG: hypothetical protein R3F34_07440 [Planctomycetota bacterium]